MHNFLTPDTVPYRLRKRAYAWRLGMLERQSDDIEARGTADDDGDQLEALKRHQAAAQERRSRGV